MCADSIEQAGNDSFIRDGKTMNIIRTRFKCLAGAKNLLRANDRCIKTRPQCYEYLSISAPYSFPSMAEGINMKALNSNRYSKCRGLLTIDPFGLRVMDLELRSEQILHSQFGVASSLIVSCKNKPLIAKLPNILYKLWVPHTVGMMLSPVSSMEQDHLLSSMHTVENQSPALADIGIHFQHRDWEAYTQHKKTQSHPLKCMTMGLKSILRIHYCVCACVRD